MPQTIVLARQARTASNEDAASVPHCFVLRDNDLPTEQTCAAQKDLVGRSPRDSFCGATKRQWQPKEFQKSILGRGPLLHSQLA